ncbi:hypothetical protein D3C80_1835840 [compost metagenome]
MLALKASNSRPCEVSWQLKQRQLSRELFQPEGFLATECIRAELAALPDCNILVLDAQLRKRIPTVKRSKFINNDAK